MRKLFREFFMSDNGQASLARILMVVIVTFYIVCASYLLYISKSFTDIPPVLAGTLALLYGTNKAFTKVG